MKNYYEILEVNPRASEEVIKKAHQVLIKKYHPDLYVGVEREKADGTFYYTYGNVNSLEAAIKLQKELEDKGITNTIIEKIYK